MSDTPRIEDLQQQLDTLKATQYEYVELDNIDACSSCGCNKFRKQTAAERKAASKVETGGRKNGAIAGVGLGFGACLALGATPLGWLLLPLATGFNGGLVGNVLSAPDPVRGICVNCGKEIFGGMGTTNMPTKRSW